MINGCRPPDTPLSLNRQLCANRSFSHARRGDANEPIYRSKLPEIKHSPVLKRLKTNPIYQRVQRASGQLPAPKPASGLGRPSATRTDTSGAAAPTTQPTQPSLLHQLADRERGIGPKQGSLTSAQRCGIYNVYTPNHPQSVMHMHSKIYCGALSAGGEHFVTASQDHVLRVFDASRDTYEQVNRIFAKDVQWNVLDIAFTSKGDQLAYSTWSSCRKC